MHDGSNLAHGKQSATTASLAATACRAESYFAGIFAGGINRQFQDAESRICLAMVNSERLSASFRARGDRYSYRPPAGIGPFGSAALATGFQTRIGPWLARERRSRSSSPTPARC
jgi:hypothetical protein